ncbi:hypothetical protein CF327_g614 [Tilletia walkeri]|nr:hypothetical protein CF327_g614 [Tilletia walkeri]
MTLVRIAATRALESSASAGTTFRCARRLAVLQMGRRVTAAQVLPPPPCRASSSKASIPAREGLSPRIPSAQGTFNARARSREEPGSVAVDGSRSIAAGLPLWDKDTKKDREGWNVGNVGNFFTSLNSNSQRRSISSSAATVSRPSVPSYAPSSNDPAIIETDLSQFTSPPTASSTSFRPAPSHTFSSLLKTYQQLSKSRLTFLVVLTAMAPYALCPATLVDTSVGSGGVGTLLALTAGTAMCSASANTFNQLLEAPYDAQMTRTRARPLPRRALSPLHAFTFAVVCGVGGTALLFFAVNPLTAGLGLANVVLYAGVYTPLKRLSIVNTWVGAAVGALPPLMGWTACTNSLLNFPSDAAGWVLASLLFAWQFPHFNSLAQILKAEYARGGYRMMSVLNPGLNKRVSLRYALVLLPLCSIALPLAGSSDWSTLLTLGNMSAAAVSEAASSNPGAVVAPLPYALLSAPINAVMIHAAYKFWRQGTDKAARWCFWVSLVHLPAVMLLAMACKRDLWNGVGEAIGMGTTSLPMGGSGSEEAAGSGSGSASQARSTSGAVFVSANSTSGATTERERQREKESLLRLDGDTFMAAKEQSRSSGANVR